MTRIDVHKQAAGEGVWHQLLNGCSNLSTSRQVERTLTHLRHDLPLLLYAARDITHQRRVLCSSMLQET